MPAIWPPDVKTLMLGKIERRRRRGWQRLRWLYGITDSVDMNFSKPGELAMEKGKPGVLQSMGLEVVGHDWTTEMNEWTGTQVPFVQWPFPSSTGDSKFNVVLALLHSPVKGWRPGAHRGCFQTPGVHRARALPLTFHCLALCSWESHCDQAVKLLGD